ERVLADSDAADDDRTGAERGAAAYQRRQQLLGATLDVRARPQVVGEHHARSEEDVVLTRNEIEDQHAVLHGDVVAEYCAACDVRAVADVAPGTDLSPGRYEREGPDPSAVADVVALAEAQRVNEHAHGSAWASTDTTRSC